VKQDQKVAAKIDNLIKLICIEKQKGISMSVVIYHNPRCSKSRQTLKLLQDRGLKPRVIEYLKTPPNKQELEKLLDKLDMEPRDLIRKKEKAYQETGLDDPTINKDQLLQAMIDHPILIERPIVVTDKKAVLGRPPENVLEIIPGDYHK
jgi:arsenate reductase